MRYFIDTEFIEDGKTIDLISIGIVCEDGREFYLGNKECNFSKASDWVVDNVLIPMGFSRMPKQPWIEGYMKPIDPLFWVTKEKIAHEIIEFIYEKDYSPEPMPTPEFWAYYADYDWVVFCQLFGTMMNLPHCFPRYCRDIKQEFDRLGNPKLPKQDKGEHNALEDARWNKKAFDYLTQYEQKLPNNINNNSFFFKPYQNN